jgi:dihydrofolate reductase
MSTDVVGIAAVARNQVIGAGNDIPWRIPEDWQRFKALTLGHVLIMGRKTYESIGRPLPGRTTLLVTRDRSWRGVGVHPVLSVEEAFHEAERLAPATVFVAGGGEIYRAAWERLDRLEITEVDQAPPGDVTFPVIDPDLWQEIEREPRTGFSFVRYRRRAAVSLGKKSSA